MRNRGKNPDRRMADFFRRPLDCARLDFAGDTVNRPIIASPIIKTPDGERAIEIVFGHPSDAEKLRRWRIPKNHPAPDIARDAMEFGKLAGKRWRYYRHHDDAAPSLSELMSRIENQPQAEIGFLLVAKSTWKRAPAILGLAWCRRTWCNHIVLDFLAAHPTTVGTVRGYAGVGTALLYSLAAVAGKIGSRLVWGEATSLSASFYQKVLGGTPIHDHFFIREDSLARMREELNLRSSQRDQSKV